MTQAAVEAPFRRALQSGPAEGLAAGLFVAWRQSAEGQASQPLIVGGGLGGGWTYSAAVCAWGRRLRSQPCWRHRSTMTELVNRTTADQPHHERQRVRQQGQPGRKRQHELNRGCCHDGSG